jgi:hypothetical protein
MPIARPRRENHFHGFCSKNSIEKNEMANDTKIRQIKKELQKNELLMREAAIKYEDLIAAKESLTSELEAHRAIKKQLRSERQQSSA